MHGKTIHTGVRHIRTESDGPSAIREKAFSEQWRAEQESDLLGHLLSNDNKTATYSDRDAEVAATIIQWLGTNVGQGFLMKVGKKIEEIRGR